MIAYLWNIILTCLAHPFYSATVCLIIFGAYKAGIYQGRIIERDVFEEEQEKKIDQRHLNQPY